MSEDTIADESVAPEELNEYATQSLPRAPTDALTAERFFYEYAQDGRATIAVDHEGEPFLWLCRLGPTLVACDKFGHEAHAPAHAPDPGFLGDVAPDVTIETVKRRWEAHRAMVLRRRKLGWGRVGRPRLGDAQRRARDRTAIH